MVAPEVPSDMAAAARPLLSAGLVVSAILLAAIGGWAGACFGAVQGAVGVALFVRPDSVGLRAGAAITLLLPALLASWHWVGRTPLVCHCARLPHPPPGLMSLTGLVVLLDLALLTLAFALTAPARPARLGRPTRMERPAS